ncbi:hypothetical protein [Paraburkholderia hospita]|uniref:hypothetical protein n=1 Tax=Paraburkholderia hospita TaxID=169430 RepID=UPI000B341231|nr:hypothetical protein [Paraburkholderia hospita]OUL85042.1 hypothetical protein CA603_23990 [Paraburkholderia hospita]
MLLLPRTSGANKKHAAPYLEGYMAGSNDLEVLHAALKEAEDELCALGDTLVNDGWDTATIAHTLHVVRIALYGSDGLGRGLNDFDSARNDLHDLRVAEAAAVKQTGGVRC